jgi:hypothetical protein
MWSAARSLAKIKNSAQTRLFYKMPSAGARTRWILPRAARNQDSAHPHGSTRTERGEDRGVFGEAEKCQTADLPISREPSTGPGGEAANEKWRRHDLVRDERWAGCGCQSRGIHKDIYIGRITRRRRIVDRSARGDDASLHARLESWKLTPGW